MGGSWCNQESGGYHADSCWGAASVEVQAQRGQRWGYSVFVNGATVRGPVLARTEVGIVSDPRVGTSARTTVTALPAFPILLVIPLNKL